MALLTLPIGAVREETPRTRVIRLPLSGTAFAFRAGQAIELGAHGQPLRKPYSVACSPEQAREQDALDLLITVLEDGSAGPHLAPPQPGMRVDIEGPFGDFRFPEHPAECRFLFIAGGTGIAPLRSMLWHALAAFPGRECALFYSARSPDEFAFAAELQDLAQQGRLELHQTVTREPAAAWTGARGRLTRVQIEHVIAGVPTLCFVCGPPALVRDATGWLKEMEVPPQGILAEGW